MPKNNDDLAKILLGCSRLMEAYSKSTQNMLCYAKAGDLDNCDLESQNRGRLMGTIKDKYREIKKNGPGNTASALPEGWDKKFLAFIRKNSAKDIEILGLLKESGRDIQKSLTSIYRIRKKIQNYKPNSL